MSSQIKLHFLFWGDERGTLPATTSDDDDRVRSAKSEWTGSGPNNIRGIDTVMNGEEKEMKRREVLWRASDEALCFRSSALRVQDWKNLSLGCEAMSQGGSLASNV